MDSCLVRRHMRSCGKTVMLKTLLAAVLLFCVRANAQQEGTSTFANGTLMYPEEEIGLLAFKSALSDPRVLSNWDRTIEPDLCLWTGVQCSKEGNVIYLYLTSVNLTGTLSPGITKLTLLRSLELRNNNISGRIPRVVAAMPSLITVKLNFNNLEGNIPSTFGRVGLRTLLLHGNKLSGTIPVSLWNASTLKQLNLADNNLTGMISPSISNLQSLLTLRLSNNSFSGPLPETIGSIPNLIVLGAANNSFTGTIPATLCNATSLTNLLLHGNQFTGSFPTQVFKCPSLANLTLHSNSLSGSIPFGFISLQVLQLLTLNNNNFSGSLPSDLSNVTTLQYLDIHNNNFSSPFPDMSNLVNLTYVDLSKNPFLGGPFPSGLLSAASSLKTLSMNDDHWEGPFPSDLAPFTALEKFNFSGNYFNGTLSKAVRKFLGLPENGSLSSGAPYLDLIKGNCFQGDPSTTCTTFYNGICFYPDQRSPIECSVPPLETEHPERHTIVTVVILSIVGAAAFVSLLIGMGLICIPKKKDKVRMKVKSVSVKKGGPILSMKVTRGGGKAGAAEDLEKGKELEEPIPAELVAPVAGGSAVAVAVAKDKSTSKKASLTISPPRDGQPLKLSLEQLRIATDNFSMRIGAGSLGETFQGSLRHGRVVAVKMLKTSERRTLSDEAFLHEVESLHRLHYRHLASLVAYCQEDGVRAFVSQYVTNGSLYDHLHERRSQLSWHDRMHIAVGVALGVDYLHHTASPSVCHGDIKSSNVLLTDDLAAKVTDYSFDKEKLLGHEANPLTTDVNPRGSWGYLDPEYTVDYKMTEKSDVYSFGVLLFELVTGRKALQEDSSTLVVWVQDYLVTRDRLPQMVDPSIRESVPVAELEAVVAVAQACTRGSGSRRPTMGEVKNALIERLKISESDAAPKNEAAGNSLDEEYLSSPSVASSGYDEFR